MLNVKRHWAYFKYILRHKYYVFVEGRKLHVPLYLLILHDWSKFLPSEWLPYANFFYNEDGSKRDIRDKTGYYKPTDTGNESFDFAWLLHQKHNKHHWQWWVLPEDDGGFKLIKMSNKYRLEMLADWRGAGLALGKPNTKMWYEANKNNMQLHPETRAWIEEQLGIKDA